MQVSQILSFGPYRIDLRTEQLWRGKQEVKLTPKALAVLRVFIRRPGQVITKDELFQVVWPQTAVSDDALTSCIQELRQALRDNARQPRYIETVHRRGYRFIAAAIAQTDEPAPHFERTEEPLGPLPLLFSPLLPEEEPPARLSPSAPSPASPGEGRGEGLAQPSSNDTTLSLQPSSPRSWREPVLCWRGCSSSLGWL